MANMKLLKRIGVRKLYHHSLAIDCQQFSILLTMDYHSLKFFDKILILEPYIDKSRSGDFHFSNDGVVLSLPKDRLLYLLCPRPAALKHQGHIRAVITV